LRERALGLGQLLLLDLRDAEARQNLVAIDPAFCSASANISSALAYWPSER
jgi:hypothetical protein